MEMAFKVSIHCGRCKTAILKTVSKLQGVDRIAIDVDEGVVRVIGEVDPICVAAQLRKVRRPSLPMGNKEEERKELPVCCKYCSGKTVPRNFVAPLS